MIPAPVGARGSWFASWKGKSYPVLHDTWWTIGTPAYKDPMVGAKRDGKRYREYCEALGTTDRALMQKDAGAGDLSRSGYIGLFEICDFVINDDGSITLKIVSRLA